MTATLTPEPASGVVAVRSENRVRDFSPLGWPRVGVEVPISLERTGENGSAYHESRWQILNYLRARYYDPTTAQFMSVDPMVSSTMSPYAYVTGNPLNGTDPSGMQGQQCPGGVNTPDCKGNPPPPPPGPTAGNKCPAGESCGRGPQYDHNCPVALCGAFRPPDYSFQTVSLGIGLLSLTLTTVSDRYGHNYSEIGPSVGPGLPFGGAEGWGWIGGPNASAPCEQVVGDFISGMGASGGMTIGGGASLNVGGPGLPASYDTAIQITEGLDPASFGPSWGWGTQ